MDTGAAGNTLPVRTFKQIFGSLDLDKISQRNDINLTAYNGEPIRCLGSIKLNCGFKNKWEETDFYVVDVTGPAIVGLPTSEKLGLVTIHIDNLVTGEKKEEELTLEKLKVDFPGQFDTIGNFQGAAQLLLKDDAVPFIDPPRKFSIHLKKDLKEELDKMEQEQVIKKVKCHTDWCSSITVPRKKDGSLRICLDPQKLNQNLKRCPHKIPTLEEINPTMAGAKVFSKLDAKAGYWSVHLEEDSQLLTTFRTPFGRYCWRRLPFGLKISQDIFQARMDEILEGLPGVIGIADDVVVFGSTVKEHDENLVRLMERAKDCGLVFNSKKCHLR